MTSLSLWCSHRLASLKEVIITSREKEDQAGFLRSAANYMRQLQVLPVSLSPLLNNLLCRELACVSSL